MSQKDKRGVIIFVLFVFGLTALVQFFTWKKQGLTIEDMLAQIMQDIFLSIYLIVSLFGAFMVLRFLAWFDTSDDRKYMSNTERRRKIRDIEDKINELELERLGLTTFRIDYFEISDSKLKYNQKKDAYLSEQIEDLENQLKLLKKYE